MTTLLEALHKQLAALAATHSFPAQALRTLVNSKLDALPLPAKGSTLFRWRALAMVAAHDLSTFKLFEGHVDALAILAELGGSRTSGETWAVWCAESPDARLRARAADGATRVRVEGRKAWCSGAAAVDHALVSAWNDQGEPCLVAVALSSPGVTVTDNGWEAVGMGASSSVDVLFDDAQGRLIGGAGRYLSRPGFWHGGAGIASGWYGAAAALGDAVRAICLAKGEHVDAHQRAHLGAIDIALASARATLRETAVWIDTHPVADAQAEALRARLVVEASANQVLHHAGRALGAGPLCKDRQVARLFADLPVFLRQSHAERDLATLGTSLLALEASPWPL